MTELNLITDGGPEELYAAYREYQLVYDRICDDIDAIDRQLRAEPGQEEGQRLVAEMSALTFDSMIVLGYVSAAFAAWIFTSHGTDTVRLPRTNPDTDRERLTVVPNRADRRRDTRGRR